MERFGRVEKGVNRKLRAAPLKAPNPVEATPAAPETAAQTPKSQEEHEEMKQILRMFDLDPHYGPFIGVDRLQRWKRAERFGLKPPEKVRELLETGAFDMEGQL